MGERVSHFEISKIRWEQSGYPRTTMGQQGFWDLEQRQQELAAKKSTLEDLDRLIP